MHGLVASTSYRCFTGPVARPRRCPSVLTHHQQAPRWHAGPVRAGGMGFPPQGDPYLSMLMNSQLFKNPDRVKEFDSMMRQLMSLTTMANKFSDFDVAGKRLFLGEMRAACDRYKVFMTRLELSDDPVVKEYLRATSAQMLNGGFTMRGVFEGLEGTFSQYEAMVIAEEAAIAAGPEAHQAFLKDLKKYWSQTALGRIDLAKALTPETLARAKTDPDFWKAVKEISENPSPAVMSRWMSNPNLAPMVTEMARAMLQQSNQQDKP